MATTTSSANTNTQLQQQHSIVAIYETHQAAEAAVKALQATGLDMTRLSIVGRDFHTEEHALGFYTSGDRMRFWGGRGAFWGSLWGMLFGSAFFFVPAVGPLLVMGPLAGWIVATLEGAAIGGAAGVLGAALASIGIPKDSVIKYELEVKNGRFLVLARGSLALIEQARHVLQSSGAKDLAAHPSAPEVIAPARPSADDAKASGLVAKDRILELLSDEEISRVATAETKASLTDGEQYLDLEHLDRGVQTARGTAAPIGRVLPRRSIREHTWREIEAHLAAHPVQPSVQLR
jgi:uncharacterized membrane protein